MENEMRQEHTPPTTIAVKKPGLYLLTEQEHVTVLAALRQMQQTPALPDSVFKEIPELGTVSALGKEGIDALCESLNHAGLDFVDITPLFGEDEDNPYVAYALKLARENELEVDVPCVISENIEEGLGAYVMAWVWVSRAEAGLAPADHRGTERELYDFAKIVEITREIYETLSTLAVSCEPEQDWRNIVTRMNSSVPPPCSHCLPRHPFRASSANTTPTPIRLSRGASCSVTGQSKCTVDACTLLPVALAAVAGPVGTTLCANRSGAPIGVIELIVGEAQLRLEGCIDPAALTLVLQRLLP